MQHHDFEKEHFSFAKCIYYRQQPKQGTDWPKMYARPQSIDPSSRGNKGTSLAAASCSLDSCALTQSKSHKSGTCTSAWLWPNVPSPDGSGQPHSQMICAFSGCAEPPLMWSLHLTVPKAPHVLQNTQKCSLPT